MGVNTPLWQELLAESPAKRVLPWIGGRRVSDGERSWKLTGELPVEHGWWRFEVGGGRDAVLEGGPEPGPPPEFESGRPLIHGYLVGDRLIRDGARVDPRPEQLWSETERIYLVDSGLPRFSRATAIDAGAGRLIYLRPAFFLGPEPDVVAAYEDRRDSLDGIPDVSPALDLAFRWSTLQRRRAEERELESNKQRKLRHRQQAVMHAHGDGRGRRELALVDFEAAAKAALAIAGAQLLDVREARGRSRMVVRYRFKRQRFECVVEEDTLRVVDAGVCLHDEVTGERGDRYFTLESLPPVIAQAMAENKLVVWRR